jgi:hypothetical protein
VSRFLEPSQIAPLRVDLRRVFWVGIGLWAVALAVVGVLAVTGTATGRAGWICLTGFALGFLALDWERRHRDR